jgi:MoaA/NifB/PqqE/SkfB family radical SAM enzyme
MNTVNPLTVTRQDAVRHGIETKLSLLGACAHAVKGRSPGQLVIQMTDRCNARCPQCGMRTTNRFDRSVINLDDARRVIDHAAAGGVRAVSFTGGEPFLFFNELIALIRHAQAAGIPYIRTGTNGYFLATDSRGRVPDRVRDIIEALAETSLYTLWISIDSSSARTHESMRGLPGVIKGIERSLPLFHECGIYPAANMGINRNIGGDARAIGSDLAAQDPFSDVYYYEQCRTAFESFYRFVLDLGFTIVNTCYPMNNANSNDVALDPVYGAASDDEVVSFSRAEKAQLYRALFDTIPHFRSAIRIFTPRASLYSLMAEYRENDSATFGCRGGIDYFFVDCRGGNAYPCGYRGTETLGRFWDIDLKLNRGKPYCRLCEWECFRDPSILLGPVLDPRSLLNLAINDRDFLGIWKEDIGYYLSCDLFNGRKPPSLKKMSGNSESKPKKT